MPLCFNTIENLRQLGFVKLAEQPGSEILYGIVTNSPIFQSIRENFTPEIFVNAAEPDTIRAVINFYVAPDGSGRTAVSTETRVACGSARMKSKFRFYWFMVKPFSKFIRRLMLRRIKSHVEFVG
jgi:hypothetical protein